MGLLPLAIGAVVGGVKGAVDHHQKVVDYNRQKELAAKYEETSPWTGQHKELPQAPGNALGDILSGGFSGGMMGNNIASVASGWGKAPLGTDVDSSPWAKMSAGQGGSPFSTAKPTLFGTGYSGPQYTA